MYIVRKAIANSCNSNNGISVYFDAEQACRYQYYIKSRLPRQLTESDGMKIPIRTAVGSHYCVHTFTDPTKYKSNRNMPIRYLLYEICKTFLLFFIFYLIKFINNYYRTAAKIIKNILNRANHFIYRVSFRNTRLFRRSLDRSVKSKICKPRTGLFDFLCYGRIFIQRFVANVPNYACESAVRVTTNQYGICPNRQGISCGLRERRFADAPEPMN